MVLLSKTVAGGGTEPSGEVDEGLGPAFDEYAFVEAEQAGFGGEQGEGVGEGGVVQAGG